MTLFSKPYQHQIKITIPLIVLFNSLSLVLFSQKPRDFLNNEVENQSELKPGENIDEKNKKQFFLKAEVSKSECYVGEPIMAQFKVYSRLDANSQVTKRPSLTGFSVIEMVDAYSNLPVIEKLNGKYFYVHLIRKVQLIPLQPGTFDLEPAEVESIIYFNKGENVLKNIKELFRKRQNSEPDLEKHLLLETHRLQSP